MMGSMLVVVVVLAMVLLTLQLYPPTRLLLAGITLIYCFAVVAWLVVRGDVPE